MNGYALVLSILIMVVGIAGCLLPALPGIPLVFLGILGYGWAEGFHVITGKYLAIMGALTLLAVLVDYLSGVWGAKSFGSSKYGMIGALLGGVIGIFFGPIGVFVGPLVGAFIGEYIVLQDASKAIYSAVGTILGIFAGIVFKVVLGLGMLISFLIVVF